MNPRPRTILGFDYGTRRIGVAVGQTLTATATALGTVKTVSDNPDWDAVSRLIKEWRPAELVVGLPLNMDGTENDMTHAARNFARELERRHQLPVHLVDERLSSLEAERILSAAGRRSKPHTQAAKEEVDKMAAQLILQTWLGQK